MYDDICTTEMVPRNTQVKNRLPIKFKIILAFSVFQVHLSVFLWSKSRKDTILYKNADVDKYHAFTIININEKLRKEPCASV